VAFRRLTRRPGDESADAIAAMRKSDALGRRVGCAG
jgi:hypothetical protein